MDDQKTGWVTNPFANQVKLGFDAQNIADTVIAAWEGINAALQLIIGNHGVNALFHRTIEITAFSYPWLAETSDGMPSVMDLKCLRRVLLTQDTIHFAAASDSMLQQFHDVLTELIGLSLTERLLRPVLDPLLNSIVTKDL